MEKLYARDIYGKTLSVSDELMFRYFELLSDLTVDEISDLKNGMADGRLHPKKVKQQLARELTARFYDEQTATKAEENFENVFKKHELPDEIPEYSCKADSEAIWLPKLLTEAGIVKGTGEARRMIKQNAVSVDGAKVNDEGLEVVASGEVLLKVGKRRLCLVKFC